MTPVNVCLPWPADKPATAIAIAPRRVIIRRSLYENYSPGTMRSAVGVPYPTPVDAQAFTRVGPRGGGAGRAPRAERRRARAVRPVHRVSVSPPAEHSLRRPLHLRPRALRARARRLLAWPPSVLDSRLSARRA